MANGKLTYKRVTGRPDLITYEDIATIYSRIFADADLAFFHERMSEMQDLMTVLAYQDSQLVGFKIGYKYKPDIYYSWLGGVDPDYRNQGIAKKMAQLQEVWARKQGYKGLRTKSMNRFKAMMAMNIKNGFDIVDVYTNSRGQTKIVFEKRLI